MRKAAVNDPVFKRLITGHDEITHNILFRIRESACADVWTDDDACVMAQSSRARTCGSPCAARRTTRSARRSPGTLFTRSRSTRTSG